MSDIILCSRCNRAHAAWQSCPYDLTNDVETCTVSNCVWEASERIGKLRIDVWSTDNKSIGVRVQYRGRLFKLDKSVLLFPKPQNPLMAYLIWEQEQ